MALSSKNQKAWKNWRLRQTLGIHENYFLLNWLLGKSILQRVGALLAVERKWQSQPPH